MAIITITVKSAGGDYSSLNAALTTEAKDLVAAGDSYVFECYNFLDTTATTVSTTWVTDSTHTITIKAATGNKHNGTRGSGYRLIASVDFGQVLRIYVNYVTIDGIECSNSSTSGKEAIRTDAAYTIIKNCLVYDTLGAGQPNKGILVYGSKNYSVVVNNLVYNCYIGIKWETGSFPNYCYNNTVLNCDTYGFRSTGYHGASVINCYFGNNATADYSTTSTEHNVITTTPTSDATGTSEIEVVDCTFTSVVDGAENAHIGAGSDLIGIGTDLRADAGFNVTLDFEGDTRPAVPCVGADEYIAGGVANPYYYYAQL